MVAEAMVAMTRITPLALALLAGCGGLLSKDVPVVQEFQVGGNLPGSGPTLPSSALTAPLAASAGDLAHLSSVTVKSVTLESTDGLPLDFVNSGTLVATAAGQADAVLATLPKLGTVGIAQFALQGSTDLKPFLAAGGTLLLSFTWSPKPVAARGLRLTLVLHAAL